MQTTNHPFSQIISLGFEECGKWKLIENQIKYELWKHQSETEVLYAFVSGEDVLYIGKTTRQLRQRMKNYQNPRPQQKTSTANHIRITNELQAGKSILIYALVPGEIITYRNWKINIAAGLEDILIREFLP